MILDLASAAVLAAGALGAVLLLLLLGLRRDVRRLRALTLATSARSARRPQPPAQPEREFVVDSLFLAQVWQYLCRQGPSEAFHYVGGHEISPNRFILTHLVPVAHAHRSLGRAKADPASSICALSQLDSWGVVVTGHFHCHPGSGPGSTYPSAIDRQFIGDLTAGGYRCLAGIASQDGYIRFVGDENTPFSVKVLGNHVREVSEHVFQLDFELANGDLPVAVPRILSRPTGNSFGSARPAVRV